MKIRKKHPHVRGEDPAAIKEVEVITETPPRAWGRHPRYSIQTTGSRNTPTCVGKTSVKAPKSYVREKHPHVRGEDISWIFTIACSSETPPRAWGRRGGVNGISGKSRNTPTCVGKTKIPTAVATAFKKHPHVRGEDSFSPPAGILNAETPPRAWGRPMKESKKKYSCRNTPTCVGKTKAAWGGEIPSPKHPHVRGEDASRSIRRLSVPKHPHVRGEDALLLDLRPLHLETPPRAWGRLRVCWSNVYRSRNTPTCVGKTFSFNFENTKK